MLVRRVGSLCVTGVALLALAGCGSDDPSPAGVAGAPSPAASAAPSADMPSVDSSPTGVVAATAGESCVAGDLNIVAAPQEPFGSTRRSVLTATNTSAAPCTLSGVGSIALLAASGKTLSTLAGSAGSAGTGIAVAPGGQAYQDVSWQVIPSDPNGSPAECLEGPALLVTPPDAIDGQRVALSVTACDSGQLEAEAWSSRPPER